MPSSINFTANIDIVIGKGALENFKKGLSADDIQNNPNLLGQYRGLLGTCSVSENFTCEKVLGELVSLQLKKDPTWIPKIEESPLRPIRKWNENTKLADKENRPPTSFSGRLISSQIDQNTGEQTVTIQKTDDKTDIATKQITLSTKILKDGELFNRFEVQDMFYIETVTDDEEYRTKQDKEQCLTLDSLSETSIDYYLVYVLDQAEGSILSRRGESTGGSIKLVKEPPKKPSSRGARGVPDTRPSSLEIYCDPCFNIFDESIYTNAIKGQQNIAKNARSNSIVPQLTPDNQWPAAPGESLAPHSWKKPPYNFGSLPGGKAPYTTPTKARRMGTPSGENPSVGASSSPVFYYNGYNHWLYTKYYGGDNYDIINEGDEGTKIGISFGKVITVRASIEEIEGKKRQVSINVTGEGLYHRDSMDTFWRPGGVGISCCPTDPIENWEVRSFEPGTQGKKQNKSVSVTEILRAQGGLFNEAVPKSLQAIKDQYGNDDELCCDSCNYCAIGICEKVSDMLTQIRNEELKARNHQNPYYSTDEINAINGTLVPKPQCVPFDEKTGDPVPLEWVTLTKTP
jgi:hypothetical protein